MPYPLSRRGFLQGSLAASAALGLDTAALADAPKSDVHRQILEEAARLEQQRRERFAAVKSRDDLATLQQELRGKFLALIGGLPTRTDQRSHHAPRDETKPDLEKNSISATTSGFLTRSVRTTLTGRIDAGDYTIDKLVYESLPGYFVPALLYKPKQVTSPAPGILSPCGHSAVGKSAASYQILHVNLVKRGAVVLTYDPVGQGERSQFWDAQQQKSRYNLVCGEHAVLGNPLYLLGGSLARYRIWDGMRGLDLLAAMPEVDAARLGCVGNSGGGTLTAYIAALDSRVHAAVISCYITTLPRRMGNRIERDPDADPEQDIFDFVGQEIDHAGLLALRAPRPTLVAAAQLDFFPIEGARESVREARALFKAADTADRSKWPDSPSRAARLGESSHERLSLVEAQEKHGLTLPLRMAAYAWFDHWLFHRKEPVTPTPELAVEPRPAPQLLVCDQGQVNLSFKSRPLLPLALEEFQNRTKPPRKSLADVLRLDAEGTDFHLTELTPITPNQTLVLCVNGNESPDWREEKNFLAALAQANLGVAIVDPRGVGKLRPPLEVKGHDYADPLVGVEENLAYNAFLIGRSLLGMRVSDVQAAIARLRSARPGRIILCGRRDAALVTCFTAAVDARVHAVAMEAMPLSYLPLFDASGQAINAASILPGLLRDYGDLPDLLAAVAPRPMLVSAPRGKGSLPLPASARSIEASFSDAPKALIDWLR